MTTPAAPGYRTISEFVKYCIISIAYQRRLHAPEYFFDVDWNGIRVVDCIQPELQEYLAKTVRSLKSYLISQENTRLVFLIHRGPPRFDPGERWVFDISNTSTDFHLTDSLPTLSAIYDQVRASSSYIGESSPESVYRVLIYGGIQLPVAPNCKLASDVALPSEPTLLRPLEGPISMKIEVQHS